MFLILLTVGGAIVWQNDAAKTKLFRELVTVRDFINHLASGYEPWQVGIYIYIYHVENLIVVIVYGDIR